MSAYVFVRDENENIIALECWGSSSKHPDSKFYLKDFNKSPLVDDEQNIFNIYQWLIECASKMSFPPHTWSLVKFANKYLVEKSAEINHETIEEAQYDLDCVSRL
ncbi:MAG: hypothetical protein J6S67_13765 [Methanobrevibacter sp.]|nr:hypothetical protein [Methanobrevibacter sp.]